MAGVEGSSTDIVDGISDRIEEKQMRRARP